MSKKEVIPFEYEEMVSTEKPKSSSRPNYMKYGIVAVVALVLSGMSFGAGMSYQKGKQTNTYAASTNDNGQFLMSGPGEFNGQGGFINGQRPTVGEVLAISSDSITIQSARSDLSQTFKITSSTTVRNRGATASVSDIKTGDTVLVTTDSSDTSTATQILLNPGFRSSGSGGTQSSPSSLEVEDGPSI
jgi:hypothetical protein